MRFRRSSPIFSYAVLACLGLVILALGVILKQTIHRVRLSATVSELPKNHVVPVQALEEVVPTVLFPTSTSILSKTDYAKAQAQLDMLITSSSPALALETLKSWMSLYPGISRSCHGLVHHIGHEVYKKYGDFAEAMKSQDDVCGSGFLHGVIESHFATVADVQAEMNTICNAYTTTHTQAKCYHGVGHGIMFYTNNDLPKSVAYCGQYTEKEATIRCAEGVFMENFNTETDAHASLYLNAENPAEVCVNQPGAFKAACYFYAPLHYLSIHVDAYADALSWCLEQKAGYTNICAMGVGSRAIKQHIADPVFVESVCAAGTAEQMRWCLDGMVSYYLVHVDSLAKARSMCSLLREDHQELCFASIASRKGAFPE